MLGVVLAFVSIQCGLLGGLQHGGVSGRCITVLGVTPGLFGDHWVSGSLEGEMCVPLHVPVVLLAQCTGPFLCSLHFLGSPPLFPPFSSFFFYSCIHYLPSKFSTVLPVHCDRCWGRFFLAGRGRGWVVSKAGSKVF